jgi:hypothetical protein
MKIKKRHSPNFANKTPVVEHQSLSYNFVFAGSSSNSYFFETRHGVVYEVKFKPSGYIFENLPALSENTFEFVIEIAENRSGNQLPTDGLIPLTIARIFFDFFREKEKLVVYICDSSDARQAVRYRKFSAWYEHYQTDNLLKIDIRLSA